MDNFDLNKYLYNNPLLKEIKINDPNIPSDIKIPEGWDEIKDPWQDTEGGEMFKAYEAPMEGWDEEHKDYVWIYKTNEGKYAIGVNYAFGDYDSSKEIFNSLRDAMLAAVKEMEELKEEWDTDYDQYDDEELEED